MLRHVLVWPLIIILYAQISAQTIVLDDTFEDWQNSVARYTDPRGDSRPGGIDFSDIRISNDQDRIFIYFNTNQEINLQSNNNITLYLDLDDNVNTGFRVGGVGADLVYEFGRRRGSFHTSSFQYTIGHNQIGLVTSPTVTSDKFELCISKHIQFSHLNFTVEDKIRLILLDNSINGDRAPDNEGGYLYNVKSDSNFEPFNLTLHKEDNEAIRVVAYNVLRDNFHDAFLFPVFNRIFNALQPDIIGFSEIYNHSSGQSAAIIERILPSPTGQNWYHRGVSPDIQIVSRYPILRSQAIDGNGAFLLDIGANKTLLVLVTHLPCCENDQGRQRESDNIMAFLRSVRFGISSLNVAPGTPYIIMGDKNFVGDSRQLKTLLTGDISDNTTFGIDFNPDWDNTDLRDVAPLTTGLPMTFTWPGASSSFSPGRLDYIIYTDSELALRNSFALWTKGLSDNQLIEFNLNKEDINLASDHLPIVADFILGREVSNTTENIKNPFPFGLRREGQQLIINTKNKGYFRIIDVTGKTLMEKYNSAGIDEIIFQLEFSGIYILQNYYEGKVYSLKFWN